MLNRTWNRGKISLGGIFLVTVCSLYPSQAQAAPFAGYPHGTPQKWQGKRVDPANLGSKGDTQKSLSRFLRRFDLVKMPKAAQTPWPDALSLELGLGDLQWELELIPNSMGLERNGDQGKAKWRCYRGKIKGRADSDARLTLDGHGVTGYVFVGGEKHFVEPLKNLVADSPDDEMVLYKDEDVLLENGLRCANAKEAIASKVDEVVDEVAADVALAKKSATQIRPCAVVELAVAAHASMIGAYTNEDGVKKRISEVVNMVDGLYQDTAINLKIRISEFVIDPPGGTTWGDTLDIQELLTNLMSWGGSAQGFKLPFDVSTLWYYQPGSGVVGLARGGAGVNTGVVCRKGQNSNAIRDFTRSAYTMMLDQAHELGHNFGAPHISDPTLIMNPSITGQNDQWGDSTISVINAYRARVTCMAACDIPPVSKFLVSGGCGDTRTFTDLSSGEPTAWQWNFGDGSGSTDRNPLHRYAQDGRYTVALMTSNAFGKDTAALADAVNVKVLPLPVTQAGSVCGTGSMTLAATGTSTVNWWDSAQGGKKLGSGPTFQTPVLTQKTTYYVENAEAEGPSKKVGPAGREIGAGAYFTGNDLRRIYFDVYRDIRLKSFKVYASGAGNRTIQVLDKAEKVVAEKTVNLPNGESRAALDFALPAAGGYAVKMVGTGAALNLYRNQAGAVFPYTLDGFISITGTDATDANAPGGYFYYFYDWEIQEQVCASDRVPIIADVQCLNSIQAQGLNRGGSGVFGLGSGRYRLSLPWGLGREVTVKVFSSQGRELLSKGLQAKDQRLEAVLQLPEPATSGLLLLKVEARDGRRNTFLVSP